MRTSFFFLFNLRPCLYIIFFDFVKIIRMFFYRFAPNIFVSLFSNLRISIIPFCFIVFTLEYNIQCYIMYNCFLFRNVIIQCVIIH